MREAIVAGQFYEANRDKLEKQIVNCFMSKFGPNKLPDKRSKKIKAIISPHAGYMYSGYCQAHVYKEIGENRLPSCYVIIGPNHTGHGSNFAVSLEDWSTQFGIVKVDKDYGSRLIKECKLIKNDKDAHKYEHCIEVQLPFLQFVNKKELNKIKILPMVVKNYNYEIIKKIADAITKIKKNIVLIASSDFTHYGYNYSYMPFTDNKKENLYKLDREAISHIERLDARGFLDFVNKNNATICGAGAIAIVIEASKNLNSKKAKLIKYYTSGDIVNNYDNAVGYGGIIVE